MGDSGFDVAAVAKGANRTLSHQTVHPAKGVGDLRLGETRGQGAIAQGPRTALSRLDEGADLVRVGDRRERLGLGRRADVNGSGRAGRLARLLHVEQVEGTHAADDIDDGEKLAVILVHGFSSFVRGWGDSGLGLTVNGSGARLRWAHLPSGPGTWIAGCNGRATHNDRKGRWLSPPPRHVGQKGTFCAAALALAARSSWRQ